MGDGVPEKALYPSTGRKVYPCLPKGWLKSDTLHAHSDEYQCSVDHWGSDLFNWLLICSNWLYCEEKHGEKKKSPGINLSQLQPNPQARMHSHSREDDVSLVAGCCRRWWERNESSRQTQRAMTDSFRSNTGKRFPQSDLSSTNPALYFWATHSGRNYCFNDFEQCL